MEQNFFDNETVFRGYCELRDTESNCNTLMEQPEMARLLPDLRGKRVLDLGCGFGHNCIDFIDRGAASVTGIDISIDGGTWASGYRGQREWYTETELDA